MFISAIAWSILTFFPLTNLAFGSLKIEYSKNCFHVNEVLYAYLIVIKKDEN